jgi:hypothetical protein
MKPHYSNTDNPIDFPKSENNMNERIKELAEQAKKYSLDAMIKIADKEQALKVYSESYDTKFAELIVRECANTIQTEKDTGLYNAQQMTGMTVSRAVIKDHFEIK